MRGKDGCVLRGKWVLAIFRKIVDGDPVRIPAFLVRFCRYRDTNEHRILDRSRTWVTHHVRMRHVVICGVFYAYNRQTCAFQVYRILLGADMDCGRDLQNPVVQINCRIGLVQSTHLTDVAYHMLSNTYRNYTCSKLILVVSR